MIGVHDLENHPLKVSQYVINENQDGGVFQISYKEVYEANRRICDRLGVNEDKDVENIINTLLDLSKYMSFKMFDYGVFFSSPSIKKS